jgi:hypothetical protein
MNVRGEIDMIAKAAARQMQLEQDCHRFARDHQEYNELEIGQE